MSPSTRGFIRPCVYVVLTAALLATSCQYDPYTASYATVEPDRKDILGTWVATDSTLDEFSGTAYSSAHPKIEIAADGKIRMTEIPDTWRDPFGKGAGKVESFVGTWKLSKRQDEWWGLDLDRNEWECLGCLMVLGDESPHKLVIRIGDPDEGRGYEFRRVD